MSAKKYVRLSEAAAALDKSSSTLLRWAKAGRIDTQQSAISGERLYAVDVALLDHVDDAETRASDDTIRQRIRDLEDDVDEQHHDADIEELLAMREKAFARKSKKMQDRITEIRRRGPFAVCHLGDPHLDDDGTNWPELRRTIRTIKRTEGLYAGQVGDVLNNWVGRLQALWRHQTSTEDQAFQLLAWFMRVLPWDYWMLGNHDLWNDGPTIHAILAQMADIKSMSHHEIKIQYTDGEHNARVVVRHDFKGNSMWNKSHALMKRSKMRPWGDLYVAGHRHTWAVNQEESHDARSITTLRVRGFKAFDEYALSQDFTIDQYGPSITTVHDMAAHPPDRIKVFYDVEMAADYLAFLRSR